MNKELMNKKNSSFLPSQIVVLGLLFFGAMNFMNKAHYFFFGTFIVFLFTDRKKIKMDLTFWCLVIIGVFFCINFLGEGKITLLIKPFSHCLCYLIGKNIVLENFADDRTKGTSIIEKRFFLIMVIISFALLIHVGLNLYINGFSGTRNTVDFWTKEILSATLQAGIGAITVGLCIAIFFSYTKAWMKILAFIALIIIMAYNLVLAGRTLILMTIIVVIFASILYVLSTKNLLRNLQILGLILLMFVIVLFCFVFDAMGVRTAVVNSNFYDRFFGSGGSNISADGRMDNKLLYLQHLPYNMWGGSRIREIVGGYAHDIFLDTFDEAGLFAFLAICIVVVIAISRFVRIIRNKNISFLTKQIIACIYLVCFIEFCVEPVLCGLQWFFVVFCIFDGMVSTILDRSTKYTRSLRKEKLYENRFN